MEAQGKANVWWRDRRKLAALAVTLAVILLVAQQTVSLSGNTRLMLALQNAAHTPWFFVVTLLAWCVLRLGLGLSFRRSLLLCAAGGILLAGFTELIQFFGSRDASLEDVARDLLGMAAALFLLLALRAASRFRAALLVALSGMALLTGFLEVFESLWYYRQRSATVPVLLDARAPHLLLDSVRGTWRRHPGLENWPDYRGRDVLEVRLDEGRAFPGLRIREPFPDWNPWDRLVIEAFLRDESPLPLTVRVETIEGRGMETTAEITLVPGPNRIEIPLHDLVSSSIDGLPPVRNLLIFSPEEQGGRKYYLGSVRLE